VKNLEANFITQNKGGANANRTSKPETKPIVKQKYSSQFFPEIARQNAKRTPRHS
jgi:hypothetical protein